jgi:hypothetical protein
MNAIKIPIYGAISILLLYIFIVVFLPFANLLDGSGAVVVTMAWMIPLIIVGGIIFSIYQKTQEETV